MCWVSFIGNDCSFLTSPLTPGSDVSCRRCSHSKFALVRDIGFFTLKWLSWRIESYFWKSLVVTLYPLTVPINQHQNIWNRELPWTREKILRKIFAPRTSSILKKLEGSVGDICIWGCSSLLTLSIKHKFGFQSNYIVSLLTKIWFLEFSPFSPT